MRGKGRTEEAAGSVIDSLIDLAIVVTESAVKTVLRWKQRI